MPKDSDLLLKNVLKFFEIVFFYTETLLFNGTLMMLKLLHYNEQTFFAQKLSALRLVQIINMGQIRISCTPDKEIRGFRLG